MAVSMQSFGNHCIKKKQNKKTKQPNKKNQWKQRHSTKTLLAYRIRCKTNVTFQNSWSLNTRMY